MRTILGDQIYRILRGRIGRDQMIHAHELAVMLGIKPRMEREIRRRIAVERKLWGKLPDVEKIFVISLSGNGFFTCANYEEYLECRKWFANDARKATQRLADLDETAGEFGFGIPTEEEAND